MTDPAPRPRTRRRRLRLLLALATLGVLVVPAGVTLAAVAPGAETPVGPDATTNSLFNLDPFIVQVLLGAAIPYLIAWASTSKTKAWVQQLATVVASAITGLITVGATDSGGAIISVASLKAAVQTAVIAMTTYLIGVRNNKVEAKLHALGPNAEPAGKAKK